MFGTENAKINSKNIWGGDRESGRDLEIEKKRIRYSHERMEETASLSLEFLQVRVLFPLVEHLLRDLVTHLASDGLEIGGGRIEIEGGDIDVAKHGDGQSFFEDGVQSIGCPASESISSEGMSVFIDEEVGSRGCRKGESELSMKFRRQVMGNIMIGLTCFEVSENQTRLFGIME